MTISFQPPPKSLLPGSIVDFYGRDSGGDAQEQSIGQQVTEVKRFCMEYGLVLRHIYTDEAVSGGSVEKRTAFKTLIANIETGKDKPDAVLIWNLSRLARNLTDSNYYSAVIQRMGVTLHSMTDPIPEGEMGNVIATIIAISNEEKRRQNTRDVTRSLRQLAEAGYAIGGKPPFGYIAEKTVIGTKRNGSPRIVSHWYVDPATVEDVRLAWRLRAEGKTYKQIQVATGGRLFTTTNSWSSFFRSKIYLGIVVCGGEEIHNHPAILDQATWEAVQAVQDAHPSRKQTNHPQHPRRQGAPSLLSGVAKCALCGSAMEFAQRSGASGWASYRCGRKKRRGVHTCENRSVDARRADTAVLDAALNRILTPDFMEHLLTETRQLYQNNHELEVEMKTLKIAIQKTERAISNLLNMVENGSSVSVAERIQERERDLRIHRQRLQMLTAKTASAQVDVTPETIQTALKRWRDRIETARQAEDIQAIQRLLFPNFITQVQLAYNQVTISYGFPLELQAEAMREHFTAGAIETTYKTQRKRRGAPHKPKGPAQRDLEIFQRHTAGETIRQLAAAYYLSEKRVWGICTAVRKHLHIPGEHPNIKTQKENS